MDFDFIAFFAGFLFGFLLFWVTLYFYERYRLIKAFKKFDADMKILRETMLRSDDAEEIADAFRKYSKHFYIHKNYE
jgi:hypothetical protein